jgi:hypothetical protein
MKLAYAAAYWGWRLTLDEQRTPGVPERRKSVRMCAKVTRMKILILILSTLLLTAYTPFKLREVYMVHRTFKSGGREPLIDGIQLKNREVGQELSLHFNTNIFCDHVYWDNQVLSYVARWNNSHPEQFRAIGWLFSIGIKPFEWLDVGYYHNSRHALDTDLKNQNFPVLDALEVKVYLYK